MLMPARGCVRYSTAARIAWIRVVMKTGVIGMPE
jgi:hypothetical protein